MMQALLTAIQEELQTEMADDVRPLDIFIAPHINYIPASVRLPCIGIKDGPIQRIELIGGQIGYSAQVKIVIYVSLKKDSASIMGDESTEQKGVLGLAADIHTALHQNTLAITGLHSAFCRAETEAEIVSDETNSVVRKILTYTYEQE